MIYNIPASTHELPAGIEKTAARSGGTLGVNDFKKSGYGGPCPPPGRPHRYFFKIYALDTQLSLKAGATKKDVEAAMKSHTLGKAELMGTYQRRGQ